MDFYTFFDSEIRPAFSGNSSKHTKLSNQLLILKWQLYLHTTHTLCSNFQSLLLSDGVPENFSSHTTPPQLLKKGLDAFLGIMNISDLGTKTLSQKNFKH